MLDHKSTAKYQYLRTKYFGTQCLFSISTIVASVSTFIFHFKQDERWQTGKIHVETSISTFHQMPKEWNRTVYIQQNKMIWGHNQWHTWDISGSFFFFKETTLFPSSPNKTQNCWNTTRKHSGKQWRTKKQSETI